ncbi:hypothetical protein PENTCL1PPCAC_8919, partial [Pristionchus entomophagus]
QLPLLIILHSPRINNRGEEETPPNIVREVGIGFVSREREEALGLMEGEMRRLGKREASPLGERKLPVGGSASECESRALLHLLDFLIVVSGSLGEGEPPKRGSLREGESAHALLCRLVVIEHLLCEQHAGERADEDDVRG